MISREHFESAWREIPGLETQRHARIVEGLIRWLRPTVVLEIGCYLGCITAMAARAIQENGDGGYVVVVDNFSFGNSVEQLEANFRATDTISAIEIIAGDSKTVPFPEHVDMALIDGHHGTDECWLDTRRSIDAGARIVCFHDTWNGKEFPDQCPGPALALGRLSAMGWSTMSCRFDRGYGVAVRL